MEMSMGHQLWQWNLVRRLLQRKRGRLRVVRIFLAEEWPWRYRGTLQPLELWSFFQCKVWWHNWATLRTSWRLHVLQPRLWAQAWRSTATTSRGSTIKVDLTWSHPRAHVSWRQHPPRFSWISLPCTRLSPLVNLTERTAEEWARFEQRQFRDLKRADEVAESVSNHLVLHPDSHFGWEWPTGAKKGWSSKAIRRLEKTCEKLGKKIYWCRFHGCAYGLTYKGLPILKSWTVMTTNRYVWLALQRKCPGHMEHVQCRGVAAQASAYYPQKMVEAVVKSIITSWTQPEDAFHVSLSRDIEEQLLEIPRQVEDLGMGEDEMKMIYEVRREDPQVLALSRSSYPKEPPTGRKLELIKQQMMRIHRSSGHASFGNLQKLLRMRKAPEWSIELAGSLQCPDCIEAQRPGLRPPASTKETPELFEVVGTDIFEFEHCDKKHKLILWRDRASGYVYVEQLEEYKGSWEPKTHHVVSSLIRWLMINPSPKWIISDAGTVFTSEEFLTFAGRSGIGVLTAPAEAHWMMGAEEGCINVLKTSVKRLMKEETGLDVAQAFALAAHGHNNTIGTTGFSPFQWIRGGNVPQEERLAGLDPRKMFGGLLRLKEKARIAYEMEHAKYKLSKLGNAVGRGAMSYRPGALVMVWRQRMRPGKVSGHWTGPARVLLQEGSTLWLANGASLIKAKTSQVRGCSKREELEASLSGAAVYRNPVTLETLMKEFTGRHYTNLTGEVPSRKRMEEDVTGAEVIQDHQPSKARKVPSRQGQKRKERDQAEEADDEIENAEDKKDDAEDESKKVRPDIPGDPIPKTDLSQALETRGPDAVDGIPSVAAQSPTGNQCRVPQCTLPGGHGGPHEDESGDQFSWTPFGGRIPLDEEPAEDDESSATSSSSEELMTEPKPSSTQREVKSKQDEIEEVMYVLEIETDPQDFAYLMKHPAKSTIWMSKKMAEKSKEVSWQRLSLERKMDYDMAQAKELSNVLQAKALRTLTRQEWSELDYKKIMGMRWVLTSKSDGAAKSRLVVLGYQAPNLTEVQASAPTMSRLSRNFLLMMCANKKLRICSGDVTSAFLQAPQSLEDENLVIWAPSELAVLFGAPPSSPVLPLKVCRAFYGLVHAPRKWYDHVTNTLLSQGWEKLLSDGCIFILKDPKIADEEDQVVAVAGIHVDDFLIGGREENEVFVDAKKKLEEAYRWGKWESDTFTFAGCRISQKKDASVCIDQTEYTEKWIEEMSIPKERAAQPKSMATQTEVSQLRGLIGSMAWRSSQTSPHFQADIGLLLSEVPYATVQTLQKANKIAREMKRTQQQLVFPSWDVHWRKLAIVVWADAGNQNRPDHSSTMGILAGCGPEGILYGEEEQLCLLSWRSSKTPRQVLGSNGAEVQAITEGEDVCFRLRTLLAELHGLKIERKKIYSMVAEKTQGAVVMDSRGIYDAMTRNVSALHGLRSGRSGYELAVSVCQAKEINTHLRWVNGDVQLADPLTKANSRKVLLQFFASGQRWRLIHDEEFISGKRLRKKELEKLLQNDEKHFVNLIREMAMKYRWPWTNVSDLRNKGDEISAVISHEDPIAIELPTWDQHMSLDTEAGRDQACLRQKVSCLP